MEAFLNFLSKRIYIFQKSIEKIYFTALRSEQWNPEKMKREKGFISVTIHAPLGSFAEEYAKENKIPFKEV